VAQMSSPRRMTRTIRITLSESPIRWSAFLIAHVAQLTLPHELEQAMSMVTENAAKAARVDDYGIAPGKRADLVVVGAPSVHEAIRLQPLRRHVIKGGREVARSVVSQELLKS
jgi:cytosine/creatinine deaminase